METEYRGLERTGLDKTGQDMRDLPLKSCLYMEMLSVRFPASGMAENKVIPLQGSERWFVCGPARSVFLWKYFHIEAIYFQGSIPRCGDPIVDWS